MATRIEHNPKAGKTLRKDAWWAQPLLTIAVLGGFMIYATFRTFENNYFLSEIHTSQLWANGQIGHLLSPFYSPCIIVDWTIFGKNISPAIFILLFPLSFRLTCYYYRKAYYRSFFWTPPACAVKGTANKKYTGEKEFPFYIQNLHRFTFYIASIFIIILSYDVYLSLKYFDGWGISVGTFVLLVNVLFLAGYTFGCHSCRHLCGGCLNSFSTSGKNRFLHSIWKRVSFLNERHALFAWLSLFSVALADLYVRLVTQGVITDYVIARF